MKYRECAKPIKEGMFCGDECKKSYLEYLNNNEGEKRHDSVEEV